MYYCNPIIISVFFNRIIRKCLMTSFLYDFTYEYRVPFTIVTLYLFYFEDPRTCIIRERPSYGNRYYVNEGHGPIIKKFNNYRYKS